MAVNISIVNITIQQLLFLTTNNNTITVTVNNIVLFFRYDDLLFGSTPLIGGKRSVEFSKQIKIKVSKYDCWFENEKVKVATMWKILSREIKPLQVIVTVLILLLILQQNSAQLFNHFYELVYSSWFSSLSKLVGEPDSNLCPMSRSLECVQGGMETLRSPGASDQQMIKWPSDYMTQWPNEKKRPMTNLILIESFLQGALIPVTLGDSHPLGRTALYEGDSYVIQYAVRCRK